jgi:heat shock protein HslJ
MSFTLALLLVALGGLGVAIWAQIQGFGLDRAAYRRRQSKAGLSLLGLLIGLGLLEVAHEGRIIQRLTAPEVDGAWAVLSIDGRPVPWREWRISVARGKVAGGRDGCNDWGFDKPEVEGGERTITTTLVGCPEEDPMRKAYWALALADPVSLQLGKDGILRLAGRGHEAVLRRCRWVNEPLPPGTSGTEPRVCAVA